MEDLKVLQTTSQFKINLIQLVFNMWTVIRRYINEDIVNGYIIHLQC